MSECFIFRRGLSFYKSLKVTLLTLDKKMTEFCQKREKDKTTYLELKKKEGMVLHNGSQIYLHTQSILVYKADR